jgi:hypothetical protein
MEIYIENTKSGENWYSTHDPDSTIDDILESVYEKTNTTYGRLYANGVHQVRTKKLCDIASVEMLTYTPSLRVLKNGRGISMMFDLDLRDVSMVQISEIYNAQLMYMIDYDHADPYKQIGIYITRYMMSVDNGFACSSEWLSTPTVECLENVRAFLASFDLPLDMHITYHNMYLSMVCNMLTCDKSEALILSEFITTDEYAEIAVYAANDNRSSEFEAFHQYNIPFSVEQCAEIADHSKSCRLYCVITRY